MIYNTTMPGLKNNDTIIEIFIIIVVALLVRFLYISFVPNLLIYPDSFGYYNIGQNMIRSLTLQSWVNPFRPFLYPVFLNVLIGMTGHFGASIQSAEFASGEWLIAASQTGMNIVGLVLFYLMLRKLFTTRRLALIVSIIQAININLIIWERSVLSESLSIPLTLILGYVVIRALRLPSWRILLTIVFLCLLGLLIRPATIIFPYIVFPFIIYCHKTRPVIFRSVAAVCLFTFFIFGYAKTNEMNWKYFGIQNSSDINILARIMQFRLSVAPAQKNQQLYDKVREYTGSSDTPNVWTFINTYNVDTYSSPENMQKIRDFDMAILKTYPMQYIFYGLADIPSSFLYTDRDNTFAPSDPASPVFFVLRFIYTLTGYLFLTSIPLILFSWARLLGKRSPTEAAVTLLGTLSYGSIILCIFTGTGNDYARFYSSIQPFLMVFCVYWWIRIGIFVKNILPRLTRP